MRQHPSAAQRRAVEAARVHRKFAELMAVGRARFADTRRPLIPAPVRPDPAVFEAQEWAGRRHEAQWWQRSDRRAIRAQVAISARQRADELHAEATRRAEEDQHRADIWWYALNEGEAEVTRAALETAFSANTAPVRVVDAAGTAATLVVVVPESSALPDRCPQVTQTGKLTTKAWTQTQFNDAYADLLGAHLLATLRKTWAVAPSIQHTRVIGTLDTRPAAQVLFDVTVARSDGSWTEDTRGRALLDATPRALRRVGRTRAVRAWPVDQLDADVAAWTQHGWTFAEQLRSTPRPALNASDDLQAADDTTPPLWSPPPPAGSPPVAAQLPRDRPRWGRAVSFLAAHPTKRAGLNWATWAAALLVVLLVVIGSATSSPKTNPAADRPAPAPTESATAPATAATQPESSAASSTTTNSGPRTSTAPHPADTTGGVRVPVPGVVLPNPARTPGATNSAVTQATITSTICVAGWTSTVRPPSSYTTALKERQLFSGYAYHGDTNPSDYEEDHLIPLELGGSPSAEANLWPEPYHVTDGAYSKDKIENKLHALVCAGGLSLGTAHHATASNWFTAYQHYIGANAAAPSGTHYPAPTTSQPAPSPLQTGSPAPRIGATGICNDGTYSYAQHHQGACSHHGGVREWL